jgi:hypothetical protein
MYALYGGADFFGRSQPHCHVNPANYEHSLVQFYLTRHLSRQPILSGINLARLQRTSKGAQHSTGRRGDGVIQRGRVRHLNEGWIYFVMLSDGAVDTEDDRL